MKRLFITSLLLLSSISFAQETIPYRVSYDNPDDLANNYIYGYYFDYMSGNSTSSLGISTNAWIAFNKLNLEGDFKLGFLGDAAEVKRLSGRINIGAGVEIFNRKKVKNVKVNVKTFYTKVDVETSDGKYLGEFDALAVQQIKVPGTYKLETTLQGGAIYRNGSVAKSYQGTFNELGIYAGIAQESKVNIITDLYHKQAKSAQYLRMYAHFVYYPVMNLSQPDTEFDKTRFGFRAGGLGHLPGMNNFINYMTPKVEVGYNPFGFYFSVGLGMNIVSF
ncbi:MAG: hypothetical protein P8P74_05075 [Crocinitomicaceae bacterium]|nr:hypothetical protein [Crocinitomicaceae bacterium]